MLHWECPIGSQEWPLRLRQHLVAFRKGKELQEKPCMVEEEDLVRWRKAWGLLLPIRRLLG